MNPSAEKPKSPTNPVHFHPNMPSYFLGPPHNFPVAPVFPFPIDHNSALPQPFAVFPAPHWTPESMRHPKAMFYKPVSSSNEKRGLSEPEGEDELRRENKKKKEKDRRDKLNTKFTHLSELLEIPDESKVDRIGILGDAISLIEKLKKELQESRAEQTRLQSVNDRLVNYLQFMLPASASCESLVDGFFPGQSEAHISPESVAVSIPSSVEIASPHVFAAAPLQPSETPNPTQGPKSPQQQPKPASHSPAQSHRADFVSDPSLSAHDFVQMQHYAKEIDPDVMLSLMCFFDGKSHPFPHSRLDYEHDGPGDGLDEDTPPLA